MKKAIGRKCAAATLAAALVCLFLASSAAAEDRVYWADGGIGATGIAFAALNGSGGGPLSTGAEKVLRPAGLAVDTSSNRIYWADAATESIAFAGLDGSGAGKLDTGSVKIERPGGLAIDPTAQRIYWGGGTGIIGKQAIFFAGLDGSGGGELNTSGATTSNPNSVTIDSPAGRVYWTDFSDPAHPISFASLDGSGHGGDLNATGSALEFPAGVAIDHANGRAYMPDLIHNTISFVNLDGSGGGVLSTPGAPVDEPIGVAIDPAAGLIYWANAGPRTPSIAVAHLDGSGGEALETTGVPVANPRFPVLFVAPRATAPPAISGGSRVGSVLSCSQGGWSPDLLESFLYDAPREFDFQWSRDGADIAGATSSSLLAESIGAAYRCRVTATNLAGATSQTSAPFRLPPIAFGKEIALALTLASRRVPAKGPLAIQIANANPFEVAGRISGQLSKGSGAAGRRRLRLGAKAFRVGAEAKLTVKLSLPKPLQRLLADKRKLSLALSASVTDAAGNQRTVEKTVVAKLAAKKRRAGPRHRTSELPGT
jgi:hypothetical protein